MRVSLLGLLLVGLSMVPLVGCSKGSPTGGPGTADKKASGKDSDSSMTFEIKVPKSSTVKQGAMNPEDVSLSRGSNFKQTVKLAFKSMDGAITLTPDHADLKGDDSKVSINVAAKDDAKVGDHIVEVTGTPESGKATSINWTISVKEK